MLKPNDEVIGPAHDDDVATRRLLAKPGMTGLWQVSGRSDLAWDEAVRLDLNYVENWSLWSDIKIMFATPFAVLRIHHTH